MCKIRKTIMLIMAVCLLFSAGCAYPNHNTPTLQETYNTEAPAFAKSAYTLLIYMCGSDLETKHGAATNNIKEILAADFPENTNIIIETGGAYKWRAYDISSSAIQRYSVKDGALTLIDSLGSASMGDEATLMDFISWGVRSFPAHEYGLILWNHGAGAVNGVCFDENYHNDGLSLQEIASALSNAKLPQKFDFIGFDACLMSTIETALTVEPYAKNMIASQDKEPSGGWDYHALVSHLGKKDFYDTVLSSFAEKSQKKQYYTLSHIELSKLNSAMDGFEKLLEKMKLDGKPRNVISAYIGATKFGSDSSEYYDLGNLFSQYGINGKIEGCITCINGEYRKDATGLSVYFPLTNQKGLPDYFTCNPYEAYSDYIRIFFMDRNEEKINFLNYAEQKDNLLSFTLSHDSMQYVGKVDYVLYAFKKNGFTQRVYALGNDNDAEISENTVTIGFEGRWVEFGGHLLYCSIVDAQDGYTIYQAPIKLNGQTARLLFSYDVTDKTIHIVGASYENKGSDRIYDLAVGDSIIGVKKEAISGRIEQHYPQENEFTYKNDMHINIVTLPDGYYQYTAFVTDVYGKRYSAGTAVVKIENGELSVETISADEVTYPE